MYLLFLLFVTLAVAANPRVPLACTSVTQKFGGLRVAGGGLAYRGQFPYQAGLIIDSVFCGGALISTKFVLTAGHCVDAFKDIPDLITVVLGARNLFDDQYEAGSQSFPVNRIVLHTKFTRFEDDRAPKNNLALIELSEKAKLSDTIATIRLPSDEQAMKSYDGKEVTLTGWGYTNESEHISNWLAFATPVVLKNSRCQLCYGSKNVDENIICTDGKVHAGLSEGSAVGACKGDDGAPLVLTTDANSFLLGVMSFTAECGNGYPSGFTKLTKANVEWINSVVS